MIAYDSEDPIDADEDWTSADARGPNGGSDSARPRRRVSWAITNLIRLERMSIPPSETFLLRNKGIRRRREKERERELRIVARTRSLLQYVP